MLSNNFYKIITMGIFFSSNEVDPYVVNIKDGDTSVTFSKNRFIEVTNNGKRPVKFTFSNENMKVYECVVSFASDMTTFNKMIESFEHRDTIVFVFFKIYLNLSNWQITNYMHLHTDSEYKYFMEMVIRNSMYEKYRYSTELYSYSIVEFKNINVIQVNQVGEVKSLHLKCKVEMTAEHKLVYFVTKLDLKFCIHGWNDMSSIDSILKNSTEAYQFCHTLQREKLVLDISKDGLERKMRFISHDDVSLILGIRYTLSKDF